MRIPINGVGQNPSYASQVVTLPVVFHDSAGYKFETTVDVVVIPTRDVPIILGAEAMSRLRCVHDHVNNDLYMCGPGPLKGCLQLPEGTLQFRLARTQSGHVVLECGNWAAAKTCPPAKYSQLPALWAQSANISPEPATNASSTSWVKTD